METERDWGAYIHFIGVGDTGNRTAIELSRIYEGIRDGLFRLGPVFSTGAK